MSVYSVAYQQISNPLSEQPPTHTMHTLATLTHHISAWEGWSVLATAAVASLLILCALAMAIALTWVIVLWVNLVRETRCCIDGCKRTGRPVPPLQGVVVCKRHYRDGIFVLPGEEWIDELLEGVEESWDTQSRSQPSET